MSKPLFKVNVSAVVKKGSDFLLIKRAEDEEVFPGHWGIPGGTVEYTDESLDAALKREFMEEVGIDIKVTRLVANNTRVKPDKAMLYLVFEAEHVAGEPKALEDTELVEWVSYEKAKDLLLTPQTLEMLELCQ